MVRIDYPENILKELEKISPEIVMYYFSSFPRIFKSDPEMIKEINIIAIKQKQKQHFRVSWHLYESEDWNETIKNTHQAILEFIRELTRKYNAKVMQHPDWSAFIT
ncbi:MAG: hypothetical protein QXL15_04930 [Candidatus Korarchaeota archaeon]